jgi:hypothetical protein
MTNLTFLAHLSGSSTSHGDTDLAVLLFDVLKEALMISGFILMMMLVLEFINVTTKGRWQKRLTQNAFVQHLLASLLGSSPGCLGAFAASSMYSHGVLSFSALLAAMLATYGDATFFLLAEFEGKGLWKEAAILFAVLFALGMMTMFFTKWLSKGLFSAAGHNHDHGFDVHEHDMSHGLGWTSFVNQWKSCSAVRGLLVFFLGGFLVAVLVGELGPQEWGWEKWTLVITTLAGLVIGTIAPEHFLQDHLWNHIVKVHILRIFAWTFGALLLGELLIENLELRQFILNHPGSMLFVACLVGLIPLSGPQFIFVVLFASGLIPFSILLTNAVVQDGDGMLPLLAHSRKAFMQVKLIKVGVALVIGGATHLLMAG